VLPADAVVLPAGDSLLRATRHLLHTRPDLLQSVVGYSGDRAYRRTV